MKNLLSKRTLNKYSRQIVLKDVGIIGQKKIFDSKILVVGAGGLGSPVIDLLVRAGVGFLGVTNSLALFVMIVFISTSFFFKPLINSRLLYAEIPPQITTSIFLFDKLFMREIKIPIKLQLQAIINQ